MRTDWMQGFQDPEAAQAIVKRLHALQPRKVRIMEVCGTHTMAIFRYGIRELLPPCIELVSGPGCPVCVTPAFYMDAAVHLAQQEDVILTTFGDLMRIPSSSSSLLMQKAQGRDIRIVYSPLDSVALAEKNPGKKVVFLSVGFETTTPVAALAVEEARNKKLDNFYLLSANKTMPEVLKLLATDAQVAIDGYLYPGHVSAVTGIGLFEEMAEKYGISGVVAGFEPLDMLYGILTLAEAVQEGRTIFGNQYSRWVKPEGNPAAVRMQNQVFAPADAVWRGIGSIPGSGLELREEYAAWDAWKVFDLGGIHTDEPAGCLCGSVLKGLKTPRDCGLYKKRCTPESPVGACMVSSEGTCAAYFRYDAI